MCKFQAVRIASEKLRELGYRYINHSLKDGELTLFYENMMYGTVDKMIIAYRYFTPETGEILSFVTEEEKTTYSVKTN